MTIHMRGTGPDNEADKRRHQAHLARLMANALALMSYQTEREHPPHELQTRLVIALSQAQEAAHALARELDPEGA